MVAGHDISLPRIQLERVDLSSMTEQQPGPESEEALEDKDGILQDFLRLGARPGGSRGGGRSSGVTAAGANKKRLRLDKHPRGEHSDGR